MKRVFYLLILLFLGYNSYSQTQNFSIGWYIIESGAKCTIILPGSQDYYSNEDGYIVAPDINELSMKAGEVVLVFEYSKGKTFCFDPLGRMVAFEGIEQLTKAPIITGCGVGLMQETIQLLGGEELSEGSYVWIVGQDISNSTIKIQVNDGKNYDVPQDKIVLLTASIKGLIKNAVFVPVEE